MTTPEYKGYKYEYECECLECKGHNRKTLRKEDLAETIYVYDCYCDNCGKNTCQKILLKRMLTSEFREQGYLQELNRQFLHPLGLALEVTVEEDGTEKLGGIWCYQEDLEGIRYDYANSSQERLTEARRKRDNISNVKNSRLKARRKALGYWIEPIIKEGDDL